MSLTIPLAALLCVPALQASMASQPIADSLLQEVLRYCQQPQQKPREQGAKRVCQQAQHICWQKPSGEQCAGCTVACDGMFLWCVYRRWLS